MSFDLLLRLYFTNVKMGGMKRRLVTVRRVADVRPIPGADRIETVVVDGWTCVCKVGEFKPDDLALFFEIDSFLPASDPRWAFVDKQFSAFEDTKGFRVKSMKLRGQISQGILQSLEDFPEVKSVVTNLEKKLGKDEAEKAAMRMVFDEKLGVKKWDQQAAFLSNARASTRPEDQLAIGLLPEFIQKTDQERIQNLPELFEQWQDQIFQESTKLDGSSMTAYFIRKDSPHYATLPPFNLTGGKKGDMTTGRFGVCSRNIDLVERANSKFWEVAHKNKLPEKLEAWGHNVAVQGELCGSSIQKNFEGFPSGFHDFYVFSVWEVDEQEYQPPRKVEDTAKELGLKHVPVNGYFKLKEIGTSIADVLQRAEGKGMNGKKREGIVLKHEDGAFSFKAISNSYLLKHGE